MVPNPTDFTSLRSFVERATAHMVARNNPPTPTMPDAATQTQQTMSDKATSSASAAQPAPSSSGAQNASLKRTPQQMEKKIQEWMVELGAVMPDPDLPLTEPVEFGFLELRQACYKMQQMYTLFKIFKDIWTQTHQGTFTDGLRWNVRKRCIEVADDIDLIKGCFKRSAHNLDAIKVWLDRPFMDYYAWTVVDTYGNYLGEKPVTAELKKKFEDKIGPSCFAGSNLLECIVIFTRIQSMMKDVVYMYTTLTHEKMGLVWDDTIQRLIGTDEQWDVMEEIYPGFKNFLKDRDLHWFPIGVYLCMDHLVDEWLKPVPDMGRKRSIAWEFKYFPTTTEGIEEMLQPADESAICELTYQLQIKHNCHHYTWENHPYKHIKPGKKVLVSIYPINRIPEWLRDAYKAKATSDIAHNRWLHHFFAGRDCNQCPTHCTSWEQCSYWKKHYWAVDKIAKNLLQSALTTYNLENQLAHSNARLDRAKANVQNIAYFEEALEAASAEKVLEIKEALVAKLREKKSKVKSSMTEQAESEPPPMAEMTMAEIMSLLPSARGIFNHIAPGKACLKHMARTNGLLKGTAEERSQCEHAKKEIEKQKVKRQRKKAQK